MISDTFHGVMDIPVNTTTASPVETTNLTASPAQTDTQPVTADETTSRSDGIQTTSSGNVGITATQETETVEDGSESSDEYGPPGEGQSTGDDTETTSREHLGVTMPNSDGVMSENDDLRTANPGVTTVGTQQETVTAQGTITGENQGVSIDNTDAPTDNN